MKAFIENEAGSNKKNIFNEETLAYSRSHTVSAEYPFPYGFLLNTISGDGDCLDCFVLTGRPLESRLVLDVEPVGMFEQFEDGKPDHKVLVVPEGASWAVDSGTKELLRAFTAKVFAHLPGKVINVGNFYGAGEALRLIALSGKDKGDSWV